MTGRFGVVLGALVGLMLASCAPHPLRARFARERGCSVERSQARGLGNGWASVQGCGRLEYYDCEGMGSTRSAAPHCRVATREEYLERAQRGAEGQQQPSRGRRVLEAVGNSFETRAANARGKSVVECRETTYGTTRCVEQ